MGIWDNVKSRLGMGGRYDDYRDRDNGYGNGYGAYDDGDYSDYDAEGAYEQEDGDYDASGSRSASSMRSYGVDRADYYNDSHAPLVSQADVRSKPLLVPSMSGQPQDRIPTPTAYPRSAGSLARPERGEDIFAFKGGLARTSGSFAELQSERLRMEDTGRLTALDAITGSIAAGSTATGSAAAGSLAAGGEELVYPSGIVRATGRFDQNVDQPRSLSQARGASKHQTRARVHRRIEHIRPMSYADAEQVAQELRRGSVVVLDLRPTRPELAKRILDFSFGAASALEGQADRHIDRVYVFARNGSLTDEERASIRI
jgi:cell division inhibitor SepF